MGAGDLLGIESTGAAVLGAPTVVHDSLTVFVEVRRQRRASDVDGFLTRSALAGSEMPAELLGVEFGLETVAQGAEFVDHERRLADVRALRRPRWLPRRAPQRSRGRR